MINISNALQGNAKVLDAIFRDAIPSVVGISTNSDGVIVHLPDGISQASEILTDTILGVYGDLVVTTDKTSMTDLETATITCSDDAISSDSSVGYVVLLDGMLYSSGDNPVVAGSSVLTLVTPPAGTYEVYMYRKTGNYQSGKVSIVVSEA